MYIKYATSMLFGKRNSQIKNLNVFVSMRQCVCMCVSLCNFVADYFPAKLQLTSFLVGIIL